jgi:hypothetical protein
MKQGNLNMSTNDNLDKLIDRLKISYKPEMIMLFGCRARNDAFSDSDVDRTTKIWFAKWVFIDIDEYSIWDSCVGARYT